MVRSHSAMTDDICTIQVVDAYSGAMEGFAVSNWREWGGSNASSPGDPVAPWQVRCIRNLGTNLANLNQTSQAVKAYSYITTGTYHRVYSCLFTNFTNTPFL